MNVGSSKGSQNRSLNEAASWLLLSKEAECVCGWGLLKETEELLPDFSGEKNTPALPPRPDSDSFNPPTLVFSLYRNPYGQSVGNHGAGMDNVPREWGEHVCVCVCAPAPFLFHLLVNKARSACNSTPPTVLHLCFCCVCLLSWMLKTQRSKWETHQRRPERGGGA